MHRKIVLLASGVVATTALMLGTTPAMAHQPRVVLSVQAGYPAYYPPVTAYAPPPVVYARPAPAYVVPVASYPPVVYGYNDRRWREHQWRKRMWRERHVHHRHYGYGY